MTMRREKLSVVASALTDDPREVATIARALGFSGVLFDAIGPSLDLTQLSASGRREFVHLLSSQNRRLVGLRTQVGPKGLGPGADVDRAIATMDLIIEAAAELKSPLVCMDIGPLPAAPRERKKTPKVTPEQAGLIILPTFAAAPAPEVTSDHETPPAVDPNFVATVD